MMMMNGLKIYRYIEGDGTAFINTGFYLPNDCVLYVIGVSYDGDIGRRPLVVASDSTTFTGFLFGKRKGAIGADAYYDGPSYVAKNCNNVSLFLTPTSFGNDSQTYNTITKGESKPNAPLRIFSQDDADVGDKGVQKFSELRVYGSEAAGITKGSDLANYTPIASFLPCTYRGKNGLWHVEEKLFLGNSAASGNLIVSDV